MGFGGVKVSRSQSRVEWFHWHPGAAAAAREGGSALREQWAWLVGGGSLALWYNTPVKQVGCYRMGWGDQDHHPSTMLAPGAGDGKGRGGWAKRESE